MIKFTMGSCDNKKTHRRKPKRTSKLFGPSLPIGHQTVGGGGVRGRSMLSDQALSGPNMLANIPLPVLPPVCLTNGLSSTLQSVGNSSETASCSSLPIYSQTDDELQLMQKLMDASDYLADHKSQVFCVICHCPLQIDCLSLNSSETKSRSFMASAAGDVGDCLFQTQPWICGTCHETIKAEDSKQTITEHDLNKETPGDLDSLCCCNSCKERREIQQEQEQEMVELQKSMTDLRFVLKCVYADELRLKTTETNRHHVKDCNVEKAKKLIERLCAFDPHDLFVQIESTGREYVVECKSRLARLCPSPPAVSLPVSSPANKQLALLKVERIGQFVAALLDEYDVLKRVCLKLSYAVEQLEHAHLCRFGLTMELNFRHLFHTLIYADLQTHLSDIACHLRELSLSKEIDECSDTAFTPLLHRYLKFDDEMTKVSAEWRECYQLIERYNDEQVAMKAKRKLMQENFENFSARNRAFEQHQILKNANHSHCPCDECSITNNTIASSGVVAPNLHCRQLGDGIMLGYASSRPMTPPQYTYIGAQQLSLDGAGEATASHLFVPYLPSFEFAGGEMPAEFDEDGSFQDDYSPSEQSASPEWKEQRMVEGQDTMASICSELSDSKQMNSSSVDSGTRCDGSDDVENDDADDEDEGDSESCDDSNFISGQLPADRHRTQQVQHEQHRCQCHYCYQQQIPSSNVLNSSTPFFARPTALRAVVTHEQQQHFLNGPSIPVCLSASSAMLGVLQSTTAGYGSSLSPLLLPQLYQLHSSSPSLVQPQRCSGDGSAIVRGVGELMTGPFFSEVTSSPSNGWLEMNKCKSSSSLTTMTSSGAATWAPVSGLAPDTAGTWRMQSPSVRCPTAGAVFNAPSPLFVRPSCATTNQPIPYAFPNIPGTAQTPLLGLQFNGVSTAVPNTSMPVSGGPFMETKSVCLPTVSSSSLPLPVSSSDARISLQLVSSPERLSTPVSSPPGIVASSKADSVENVTKHSCQKHAVPPSCGDSSSASSQRSHCVHGNHQHVNHADDDNEDDDDDEEYDEDEDETGSDDSSAGSNQKDGKFCECWHCEFFGHSGPPTVPTSKNYPEMRDRLRLRLKKKNEQMSCSQASTHVVQSGSEHELQPCASEPLPQQQQPAAARVESATVDKSVLEMDVDKLLEFINGKDSDKSGKASRKAAKRARQKQRKAAEKVQTNVVEDQQLTLELSNLSVHNNRQEDRQLSRVKNDCKLRDCNSGAPSNQSSSASTELPTSRQQPACRAEQLRKAVDSSVTKKNSSNHLESKHGENSSEKVDLAGGIPIKNETPERLSQGDFGCKLKETRVLQSNALSTNFPMTSINASTKNPVRMATQKNNSNNSRSSSVSGELLNPVVAAGKANSVLAPASVTALVRETSKVETAKLSSLSNAQQPSCDKKVETCSQSSSKSVKSKLQGKSEPEKPAKTASPKPVSERSALTEAKYQAASTSLLTSAFTTSGSSSIVNGVSSKTASPVKNGFCLDSAHRDTTQVCTVAPSTKQVVSVTSEIGIGGKSSSVQCSTSSVKQASSLKSETNCCTVVTKDVKESTSSRVMMKQPITSLSIVASVSKSSETSAGRVSNINQPVELGQPAPSASFFRSSDVPVVARIPEIFPDLVPTSRGLATACGSDASVGKNKKNRRKGKGKGGLTAVDEIFLPKDNVEPGRLDDFEREIEEFKRFCFNSTPADNREKLQVNMNLKDIFAKKKAA